MKRKKTKVVSEEIPLMSGTQPSIVDLPGSLSDDNQDDTDDLQWLKIVTKSKKQNVGRSLLATDAILLLIHYIQLYAVVQSISIRWPWPESWLKHTKYIFLCNADIWEFMKMFEAGVFKYVQYYYVASDTVSVDYMHLTSAWGGLLFLLMVVYIGCYLAFTRRRSARMLTRLAMLKRVLIISLQVLALPVGVFLCRLFHCNSGNFVDVKNILFCFKITHWAYLGPALVVLFLIFIIFPAWLIVRTKYELINTTSDGHEGYLQLKEMEYIHGLDIHWVAGNFHIFAPFKNSATHFRAAQILIFSVILITYAALFNHPFMQAIVLNSIFFILFIAFCILRPFRVKAYNAMLIINYLCLTINCLTGCFKTSYDFSQIQSPWLLPDYQFLMLVVINGFWLLCAVIFILFLVIRTCCCQRKQQSIWPLVKFENLSPETRKYIRGIIIAKLLVEKTMTIHPMFAPIHEVARYIHIINAYCREAEYMRDPLQTMLWDVLDELIEIHTKIAPKCFFAESTKESIRQTATEFLTIMPAFVRRLAQREYDFILIHPTKRRMLLKLYCLSMLLKGSKVRRDRRQLTVPAIHKIWHKHSDEESDPGYYEDMYPPREALVPHRVQEYDTDVLIQLEDDLAEDNDSLVIEETEHWLQNQGLSAPTDGGDASNEMSKFGVSADRPDSVISDLVLPGHFTIPGLTYTEESLCGSEDLSLDIQHRVRHDDDTDAALRPDSVVSVQSDMSLPMILSRPASAMSTATLDSIKPGSSNNRSLGYKRPGSSTSRPRSSTSRPRSSTSRPGSAATTDLLSVEESLPGAVTAGDEETTVHDQQPRPTSASSVVSQDSIESPRTSAANSISSSEQGQPGSTQDKPGTAQDKPGSAQDKPIAAQDKLAAAQDKPIAAQDKPAAAQDKPIAAQDKPAVAQDKPAAAQDKPGSAQERPSPAQEKPGSAQGKAGSVPDIDSDEDILV